MSKEQILMELQYIIDEGKQKVLSAKWVSAGYSNMVNKGAYDGWRTKALAFSRMILPSNSDYITALADKEKHYYANAESCISSFT